MHTLAAFFDCLVDEQSENEAPRVADGPLPVTVAQVDEALEAIREAGLGRAHLAALKRGRDLLATAETERTAALTAAGGRAVTRAELDAFVAAMGVVVAAVELASQNPGRADSSIGWQLAHAVTPDMSESTRDALNQLRDDAKTTSQFP